MKTCFKCGEEKSLDEFYKHPRMADGHLNKCKSCTRGDVSKNREEKLDYYQQYDRDRGNLPHRVESRYEYVRTEGGRAARARAGKAYNEREELRYKAHYTLTNAIRDGKFRRECICEECLSFDKVEGHHDDYRFPLEVRWLCEECHKDWHRKHDPIYS